MTPARLMGCLDLRHLKQIMSRPCTCAAQAGSMSTTSRASASRRRTPRRPRCHLFAAPACCPQEWSPRASSSIVSGVSQARSSSAEQRVCAVAMSRRAPLAASLGFDLCQDGLGHGHPLKGDVSCPDVPGHFGTLSRDCPTGS